MHNLKKFHSKRFITGSKPVRLNQLKLVNTNSSTMKKTFKKFLRWMFMKPIVIGLILIKYNCNLSTAKFIYANWYKPFNQI